ncbi:MAG: SDR family NAD(P)-dependent oxidoreductase, partial [Archangium sp.]
MSSPSEIGPLEQEMRHRHRELEARLLRLGDVLDCAVLPRETSDGRPCLLAYLVPTGHADVARLRKRVDAESLVAGGAPLLPVWVSHIPRTAGGSPDVQALRSLPVLTPQLLREYEHRLNQGRQDGRFQLELAVPAPAPERLHLADLDREWQAMGSGGGAPVRLEAAADTPSAQGGDVPLSICHGGELRRLADDPETLPQALRRAAECFPHVGIHVVLDRHRTRFIDYPSLLARALRILGGLQRSGLRAGDIVLLQLPSLEDYFPALWACLLGGIRSVTIARPPGYDSRNAVLDKLYHAWRALERPVLLGSGEVTTALRRLPGLYAMEGLRVLAVEDCEQSPPAEELYSPEPTEVALLQLSSGSTDKSKVIQISHRGVVEYAIGDRAKTGQTSASVTFNWLPMDHVGPLLAFHLRDVVLGCTNIHASPEQILEEPLLWLDIMERHRVNYTWCPNFGYKLLVEALRKQPTRHWDLSPLRTLLNGGEQCTPSVVRDFLAATARFGITPDRMLLAFGMAETCTGIFYKSFADADTVQRIRTASLGGTLQWAPEDADPAEQTTFLSMGTPALGVTLRVVDPDNQLLPEGRIGRLQVRSNRVTPGYLNNPEANREAFPDGDWFNTGDLAFMKNGQVTVTGREKNLIIINGSNYFCHEIEDVVSDVEGVVPSFAAACGVPVAQTGSEALVVFFVPEPSADPLATLRRIRSTLATHFHLTPALIVPVAREEFPKTTSGKLQRNLLKQRLLSGDFAATVKALDLREGNANTVPDCVYRLRWEARESLPGTSLPLEGATLVFMDEGGLGASLCGEEGVFRDVIQVRCSEDYAQLAEHQFRMDPRAPAHWDALFRALRDQGVTPKTLLYLWSYLAPPAPDADDPALGRAMALCGEALLSLGRAFASHHGKAPFTLVTVSRQLHRITGDEAVCYPAALTAAIAAGLRHEWPQADVWHLDLPGGAPSEEAGALLEVLRARRGDTELAWRNGRQHVRGLHKASFGGQPAPETPLRQGACYLVSGGLGGIGAELLAELLQRYQLNVLLVGRTPLRSEHSPAAQEKSALLEKLASKGGTVLYRAVDVRDAGALAQAVREAEAQWQRPLEGVLHLAGSYEFRLLLDEEASSWQRALSGKVLGGLNLAALLRNYPRPHFITFSSLLGLSGAAGSTAYGAANRFLEAFCAYLEAHTPVRTWCLSWALWQGIGLNRDNPYEDQVRRRGVLKLSASEGCRLTRAVLSQTPGHYLIGIEAGAAAMRQWLRAPRPCLLEVPVATWVPAGPGAAEPPPLPVLDDGFGQRLECTYRTDSASPGPTDTPAEPRPAAGKPDTAPRFSDRSGLKQQIQAVFQDVLSERVDERR